MCSCDFGYTTTNKQQPQHPPQQPCPSPNPSQHPRQPPFHSTTPNMPATGCMEEEQAVRCAEEPARSHHAPSRSAPQTPGGRQTAAAQRPRCEGPRPQGQLCAAAPPQPPRVRPSGPQSWPPPPPPRSEAWGPHGLITIADYLVRMCIIDNIAYGIRGSWGAAWNRALDRSGLTVNT